MFKLYQQNVCYIIAEIGGNFTNFEQARALIDAAVDCGVDCVKLQTYKADTVSSRKAVFDMENTGVASQYDLFKLYEIDKQLHVEIFNYIDEKNLDWFSTPSHETDLQLLEELGVGAYKIGSDDATNLPFLKQVAKTGKPILLSTGMCTLGEVREAVDTILSEGNDKLIVLHAVTSYPTHPENINLGAIHTLQHEFPQLDIGYSDHSLGTTACICAAAMGARVIEKHFTCDKHADGPDHILSADPAEMKAIVASVREFETMRGNGIKRPASSEEKTRINNRKSIVVVGDLSSGTVLDASHLAIKRPGYGIQPKYLEQIIGSSIKRDLSTDEVLMWKDLD